MARPVCADGKPVSPESGMSRAVRWDAVGVAFGALTIAYGIWYSTSVLLVEFERAFGWSRGAISGGFAVFSVCLGASGALAGRVADRRHPIYVLVAGANLLGMGLICCSLIGSITAFYLLFGVVCGCGCGLIGWVPCIALLQRVANERLGTAVGVASSGIGVGILAVVPSMSAAMEFVGWRTAFILAGALVVALGMIGWFVLQHARVHKRSGAHSVTGEREGDVGVVLSVVGDMGLWRIIFAFAPMSFANAVILVHNVASLRDAGYRDWFTVMIVSLIGGSSLIAKSVAGVCHDRIQREVVHAIGMTCGVLGVGFLLLASTRSSASLAICFALFFSCGYSAGSVSAPLVTAEAFGKGKFGLAHGMQTAASTGAAAVGAFVGGALFDLMGNYRLPFCLAIIGYVGSGIAVWHLQAKSPLGGTRGG